MKLLKPRLPSLPSRRNFLRSSLVAGGTFVTGLEKIYALLPRPAFQSHALQGGIQTGTLDFVGESHSPLGTLIGAELNGRLYSDLSQLSPENPLSAPEQFYIRTRASSLLNVEADWGIKIAGLAARPTTISAGNLRKNATDSGLSLMECSGNARATRFGMLSAAQWRGVPISALLMECKPKSGATRVMVSGYDTYSATSATSIAGADWIFTVAELKSTNAFLATEMDGEPLSKDHGAPVRLVVPGWYGCCCIKWVNGITLLDDAAAATSQMLEFAARTHQQGAPKLAREFRPASIDAAAMPTRIEKWLIDGKIKYRVAGILWGGTRPVSQLEIRFNPEEDYVRVDELLPSDNGPLRFWSHPWTPKTAGTYMIRLRVADPVMETKRLDSGYYVRSVEVNEV